MKRATVTHAEVLKKVDVDSGNLPATHTCIALDAMPLFRVTKPSSAGESARSELAPVNPW
jgi:hypothetical protein